LSDPTYLTSTEMETYAEKTFSSLLYLSLEAAGQSLALVSCGQTSETSC